jgi:hypothetical protein
MDPVPKAWISKKGVCLAYFFRSKIESIIPGHGDVGVSVNVGVGGMDVFVHVGDEVKVADGGTRVKVHVGVDVGVIDGVQVGGMKCVGVLVGVPVWVGVSVTVAVWLGVSVFNTGVTEKFRVGVKESVGDCVSSVFPPLGATMIATNPTQ